jgi:hypothetical protein
MVVCIGKDGVFFEKNGGCYLLFVFDATGRIRRESGKDVGTGPSGNAREHEYRAGAISAQRRSNHSAGIPFENYVVVFDLRRY